MARSLRAAQAGWWTRGGADGGGCCGSRAVPATPGPFNASDPLQQQHRARHLGLVLRRQHSRQLSESLVLLQVCHQANLGVWSESGDGVQQGRNKGAKVGGAVPSLRFYLYRSNEILDSFRRSCCLAAHIRNCHKNLRDGLKIPALSA